MQKNQTDPQLKKNITKILAPYRQPVLRKSLWQLINTLIPFGLLWYLMLLSLDYSYWITILLAVPAGGLLVRTFIIQHDCGHGSFFKSKRANDTVGFFLGIMTLTPYKYWRKTHAIHHATSGDLNRRYVGDVITLTVDEYLALSPWKRFGYRFYRNPLVFFGIGPTYLFVLKFRLPLDLPWSSRREWASVMWTNLAILAVLLVMWQTIGIERFLMVQVPIFLISAAAGVWMFYIQHQFEDTYWEPHSSWDYFDAALQGCSLYDLPRVLHWFTGNIGFHHIHHLNSLIPNYKLEQAYKEVPAFQEATHLKLWGSLKCASLKLWDPKQGKLVGFGHLKSLPAET